MAIDQASYTFVDVLAKTVPELGTLLATASKQKWDQQRFIDAVQTTQWWRKNSDTAKQMIQLQATDPAQFTQSMNNAVTHVKLVAANLGIPLTDAQAKSQATADLFQGLDDATLQYQLGALYKGTGTQTGHAATIDDQIRQTAAAYGIPVTESWVDHETQMALMNGTGVEGAAAQLKEQAKSAYPSLVAALDAGQTTAQIAQPFIAQMSQTLELADSGIQLSDPTIQRALKGQQQLPPAGPSSGPPRPAPPPAMTSLHDFQQQLKTDPRWEHTDNAKADAYSLLTNIGSKWGFGP